MKQMKVVALIPMDLRQTPLGLPSLLLHRVAGQSILQRTLMRVAQVDAIESIVLVHPVGQAPLSSLDLDLIDKPVRTFACETPSHTDTQQRSRLAGRKWSLHSWRGGLGSATCYDELLPAAPLADAMKFAQADSALLVGADWPLVDPHWCRQVIIKHLEAPHSMKMVFTQAPPGLAGIALAGDLIENLARNHAGFGHMLGYVPTKPQADPIGLDVCVQIPPAVRGCARRFIYDTPRSAALLDAIITGGEERSDAEATCDLASVLDFSDRFLPQQITLEITPDRLVRGPITPHHYAQFTRPPMAPHHARRIIEELGDAGDIALTLGGLGDALLHPDWQDIVQATRTSRVLGLTIETDLLIEESQLAAILDSPIDVLSVRLNADTAATYERVMGADRFAAVTRNLQWLLTERRRRGGGLPWIVPRLVKTRQTLPDMESFFDRWMHFTGHAVIEPATTGRTRALPIAPEQSPVLMAPPRRVGCRQLTRRLSILSDGTVPRCDQDWLGEEIIGDTRIASLFEIWRNSRSLRERHAHGRWNELTSCAGCHEWHRP